MALRDRKFTLCFYHDGIRTRWLYGLTNTVFDIQAKVENTFMVNKIFGLNKKYTLNINLRNFSSLGLIFASKPVDLCYKNQLKELQFLFLQHNIFSY